MKICSRDLTVTMYLPSLLLLLAISHVEPWSACDRGKWNHARSMFHQLSNDVINHDHDMAETCKHFTQYASRQVFGGRSFRIEVDSSAYPGATWEVKLKHRVLYILGHYPQVGKTCDFTFGDLKVLPHFADTHSGAWTIQNGVFVVAFNYKYTLNSNHPSCYQNIDTTTIDVRRGFPTEAIFSDI